MSDPRNYFNYFTEVEEYFAQKRQKSLLVSPLDWCLIELWKENEVPLHIVQRGIDRSFESAAERRKQPPTTLYYCHPAVMEAFEEYRESQVGKGDDSLEDEESVPRRELMGHLEALIERLTGREPEAFAGAVRRLEALQEELQEREKLNPRQIDRELEEICNYLLEQLLQEDESEIRQEMERQAKRELKIYRKRVSKEIFERLKEKHTQRLLRDHFNLPDFSILQLS